MTKAPKMRSKKRKGRPDELYSSFNGVTIFWGRADDPRSRSEYHDYAKRWLDGGGVFIDPDGTATGLTLNPVAEPEQLTVAKLVELYRIHVKKKRGEAWLVCSGHGSRTYYALEDLERYAGAAAVDAFGPLELKAVRCSTRAASTSTTHANYARPSRSCGVPSSKRARTTA